MTQDDQKQLFDRWADWYDESVRRGDFPLTGYDDVLDRILADSQVETGMTVLDLGIGTGNLAARFAERGCWVWGLDFAPAMIARAQIKVPTATLAQAGLDEPWPAELDRRFHRVYRRKPRHVRPVGNVLRCEPGDRPVPRLGDRQQ